MARDRLNVFVNVPFDEAYGPLFEALVFAITACGYRVRCALEDDDSGDIRLDRLVRLIQESPARFTIYRAPRSARMTCRASTCHSSWEWHSEQNDLEDGRTSATRSRSWCGSPTGFLPIFLTLAATIPLHTIPSRTP